jgi:hypothetical protein
MDKRYIVSVNTVKCLSYNVRVQGLRSIGKQEFTDVNDWLPMRA